MKTPICSFDAKSGVLCRKCEAKLKSGSITQDDVDAAKKLIGLADRNQDINKFTFIRGTKVHGDLVLEFRGPDVSVLRSNKELASKIEKEMGQKVWFVETEVSDRRFIESLFHPAKVLSVNFFWLPEANKLTKVIVADDPKNVPVNIEKLEKIAKAIRNIELLVEFKSNQKRILRKMVLNDIKRTHYARQVDSTLIGQQVRVGGWIEDIRDIGKLAFVTIRDATGICQVIVTGGNLQTALQAPRQSVVTVIGTVQESKARDFPVELKASEFAVVTEALHPLPIDPTGRVESAIDKRLDARALDLRNPRVAAHFPAPLSRS